MPRALKWILLVLSVLVLALGGRADRDRAHRTTRRGGALDTELDDVTVSTSTTPTAPEASSETTGADRRQAVLAHVRGDPQRSLARPDAPLGLPARKPLWSRGLAQLHRVPADVLRGRSLRQHLRGCDVRDRRGVGQGAVAPPGRRNAALQPGDRRAAASSSAPRTGTVTALDREEGRTCSGRCGPPARSSPPRSPSTASSTSARTTGACSPFAAETGSVRWAYRTGGRINASPSVFGGRVCVTTYAGSFVCLDRKTGPRALDDLRQARRLPLRELLRQPVVGRGAHLLGRALGQGRRARRRDRERRRGPDASAGSATRRRRSPEGACSSAGSTAVSARFGRPAATSSGARRSSGRILGAPVVIGENVFFSTLEKRTYAVRASDGKIVWRLPLGKYSPGIATERTYFFSLNGRLLAIRGRDVQRAS